jgi:glycosyltransferase involved in cell wall biosynthesis/SAM-dependent methyltransferase
MPFRFHVLGLVHTQINAEYVHCAYSQKVRKFCQMMVPRGHSVTLYSPEGADVPCENVEVMSEAERASYFGPHDPQKLYDLLWDSGQPYWQLFNQRCIESLRSRVRKGDFILTTSGCVQQPVADAFPGSYSGPPGPVFFVEPFIGYYGTFSRYRVYESHAHREWCMGKANVGTADNDTAVVENYWNLDDFVVREVSPKVKAFQAKGPYYLFFGRVIPVKGWHVAVEVTRHIGARLIIAGQGDPGVLEPHVDFFGAADVADRAALVTGAIACFCPTAFREPFGGTAVESQLCGTPAITTDHGAFTQTVDEEWRCNTHREFIEAARHAAKLLPSQRALIKKDAEAKYSLEAIAPKFERYFQRLTDRWGAGYYARTPVAVPEPEPIALPPSVDQPPPPPSAVCDFIKITDEETPQAIRIAQWMKQKHPDKRILDVGCGPGIYVEEMRKVGIEAYGVDNDSRLIEGPYLIRFDITEFWEEFTDGFNARACPDIVLSLEVGEHIPEEKADAYIEFLMMCEPDLIYFSAARPGQGGNGHINLQPKSYWIERFYAAGFWLDVDAIEEALVFIRSGYHLGWLTQNLCVFRRARD